MSALDDIRSRVEADSKIPHYRTGPGKCVCGFDAYRVGYYVYDYGEERQRHQDAAIKAGKKKATDAGRLLGALDAVLALADDLISDITGADGVENEAQDEIRDQIAGRIRAAVNDALEAGK